jgi:VRR-NUC domain
MHAENSLCLTLFALICWDGINAAATTANSTISNSSSSSINGSSDNSSVHSRYRVAAPALWQPTTQLSPLLEGICRQVEAGDAPLLIKGTWSHHYGELCTGLNWNLLSGRQQYQQQQQQHQQGDESDSTSATAANGGDSASGTVADTAGAEPFCAIAQCIGPRVLGAIVRTLASNYWAWRHGLPDLFLWRHSSSTDNNNSSSSSSTSDEGGNSVSSSSSISGTGGNSSSVNDHSSSSSSINNSSSSSSSSSNSAASQCVFAEVKGPGDSLSHAQSAWIDKLLAAGATVELVKVEKAAGAFVQSRASDVQIDNFDESAPAADEDETDNGELD